MKVAIAVQNKSRDAPLDHHFARARYFLIVDTSNDVRTICNTAAFRETHHLAGTQVAGMLVSLGVQAVMTTSIGPKAFITLTSAGVRVFQSPPSTAMEVIDLFNAGKLPELTRANAEEHWPQGNKA